jgi:hypothetical protein
MFFNKTKTSNVASSAECRLRYFWNLVDHVNESQTKREKRLQYCLREGLGYDYRGGFHSSKKWNEEKMELFRTAFPEVRVSYAKGWCQLQKVMKP